MCNSTTSLVRAYTKFQRSPLKPNAQALPELCWMIPGTSMMLLYEYGYSYSYSYSYKYWYEYNVVYRMMLRDALSKLAGRSGCDATRGDHSCSSHIRNNTKRSMA